MNQSRIETRPASTHNRSRSAKRAWATRRSSRYRASKSEAASKTALSTWCRTNGWKVVFFEGPTGAARTGIVDAVITRIAPRAPDTVDVQLVQLKSGLGGLTGTEIRRLKAAAAQLSTGWILAAFDGQTLH